MTTLEGELASLRLFLSSSSEIISLSILLSDVISPLGSGSGSLSVEVAACSKVFFEEASSITAVFFILLPIFDTFCSSLSANISVWACFKVS